jgi:hypothetical protein
VAKLAKYQSLKRQRAMLSSCNFSKPSYHQRGDGKNKSVFTQSLWSKLTENTNTSSDMNSRYNTQLWLIRANSIMQLYRGPACFNSWTTMQKTMHTDVKLLAGWEILLLPRKKLLCNCVYRLNETLCTSICHYNTVLVMVKNVYFHYQSSAIPNIMYFKLII